MRLHYYLPMPPVLYAHTRVPFKSRDHTSRIFFQTGWEPSQQNQTKNLVVSPLPPPIPPSPHPPRVSSLDDVGQASGGCAVRAQHFRLGEVQEEMEEPIKEEGYAYGIPEPGQTEL